MSSANSEQKLAIEHSGGVLLSAGAGSGKTFVLIQHIFYLIDDFLKKNNFIDKQTQKIELKKFLSKIVMMTFTRKAAGEMSLRLHREIQKKIEIEEKGHDWEIIKEAVDSLSITTIHGFCLKLIREGVVPEVSPEFELVSDVNLKGKIEALFNLWCEQKIEESKNDSIFDSFIQNSQSLVNSLLKIFNDPGLRTEWLNDSSVLLSPDLSSFFKELVHLKSWNELFYDDLNLDSSFYASQREKKWHQALTRWQTLRLLSSIDHGTLLQWKKFFTEEFKVIRKPKGSEYDDVVKILGQLSEFRSFFKKNLENLDNYLNCFNDFMKWSSLSLDLVNFIEKNYSRDLGLSFSDLEYYTLKSLQNEEIVKVATENYKYLIVDEFQDTSPVQYEILKKIINNDYKRLFAVGDPKQAIYGFRGGELGVFNDFSSHVPENYSLKKNYRSENEVIQFNNDLFELIFPLGPGYEGRDPNIVQMTKQDFPDDVKDVCDYPGEILEICSDVTINNIPPLADNEKEKMTSFQMNYLESMVIVRRIAELLEKGMQCDGTICVLYRNLNPAMLLVREMINEEFGFNCQMKVPYGEDPIFGIFNTLLEGFLTNKENGKEVQRFLQTYFEILSFNNRDDIESRTAEFYKDLGMYGVFSAFEKFIFNLGIKNSQFQNNMDVIRDLCLVGSDNIERIWRQLHSLRSQKYSMDFEFGQDAKSLRIMTAHSSKGLEFDYVILAGIYTNERTIADKGMFGSLPGSFKWRDFENNSKSFDSPNLILEKILNQSKNFSEVKRLIYVACTRAVKSLSWVCFSEKINGYNIFSNKNSWINCLNKFKEELRPVKQSVIELNDVFLPEQNFPIPLFHRDNMGLENIKVKNLVSFIPELAVTKLSYLVDCPFKFYLNSILKIAQEEIVSLGCDDSTRGSKVDSEIIPDDEKQDSLENIEHDWMQSASKYISSSAQRGTLIHESISDFIKKDEKEFLQLTQKDQALLDWVFSKVSQKKESHHILSEESIKFSLFGFMVSGIPDAVLTPKGANGEYEIWDFKTGRQRVGAEENYWFQLQTYGYALYRNGHIPMNQEVELSLLYIDEQKQVKKSISFEACSSYLKSYWSKLVDLSQKNRDHCSSCLYGKICRP